MTAIFGYSAEEFYAQPEIWHQMIPPQEEQNLLDLLAGPAATEKGLVIRCLHKDGRPVWTEQTFSFLKSPAGQVLEVHGIVRDISARHEVDEERERLAVEKEEAARRLAESYERMIEGWALALELRDRETEGHSLRVAYLTVELAEALGVTGDALNVIRRGALLHDIGKMGVPDSILKKPGPLTDEEWKVIRQHPDYAYKLIHPIPYLRDALVIPYGHHERWDGSGYPGGLKGKEIPFAARIFAVVDVWDALSSDQPYRPAWDRKDIVRFLREQAGIKFDPRVVAALLDEVIKV
jgi:putative nucleotidyltransferase with HDIG domain/PAS domain S-box-containing protein